MIEQTRQSRSNSITTIIGHKGDGKTVLSEMLTLINNKPTIIADPRGQYPTNLKRRLLFTNPSKLLLWLAKIDNFKNFYNYKLELVCKVDDENIQELINGAIKMFKITLLIDEIDMFFPTTATNKNAIYKAVHYGRHNEIDIISTSRRPANISRNLTSQTDTFYFSKITEPKDLQYLKEISSNEDLIKKVQSLEKYNFVKIEENGIYSIVKTTELDIKIIDKL
jgi:hypothetical protein